MEYAVVEIGGKQYKVKSGDFVDVDRLKENNGTVSFDKVLLHVNDSDVNIGKPYLSNLVVLAKVVEQLKGDKLRVARFTAKSRHRRVIGFRASLTRVQIEKISPASSKSTKSTSREKVKAKKA